MESIFSPLSLTGTTLQVKSINKKQIINAYKAYGIDISKYFQDIKNISIYHCNDTGYKFYYPLNLAGDSSFYEYFQKFKWYYMPWKWEHEKAIDYIKSGYKILEIGCAHGAFLKRINELFKLSQTIGLELNESTARSESNFQIFNDTIQQYSKANKNTFDLVCSFQVLEHISEVNDFLSCSIDCLKKGGILLISVPNNNSYIKNDFGCLNMPPHHLGLWDEQSLKALADLFPLKIINIHLEELQDYHVEGYLNTLYYSKYNSIFTKIKKVVDKTLGIYQKRFNKIMNNRKSILGQNILISFEKL